MNFIMNFYEWASRQNLATLCVVLVVFIVGMRYFTWFIGELYFRFGRGLLIRVMRMSDEEVRLVEEHEATRRIRNCPRGRWTP